MTIEPIESIEPLSFACRRAFAVIAVVEALALVAQFVLMAMANPLSPLGLAKAGMQFFSFFTIVSNTLVAIVATRLALGHVLTASLNRWAAAVAVYITMVAVVWMLLLRGTYSVAGLGAICDLLMHQVIPPAYVIAWAWLLPKGRLRWIDAAKWLILPLAYAGWIFGRGAVDGWYPYPFINVAAIGYPRAGLTVLVLIATFWIAGLLCVAADRWIARSKRATQKQHEENIS